MIATRTHGLSAFAVLGVAFFVLTGCSSTDDSGTNGSGSAPATEEQSVEDACTALIKGVTEMEASITESATELQNDPAAAEAAFQEFIDLFEENNAKVTNVEVKATADKISDVFVRIGEARDTAATNPEELDSEAMTDLTTDLEAATTELDEVCGAA